MGTSAVQGELVKVDVPKYLFAAVSQEGEVREVPS